MRLLYTATLCILCIHQVDAISVSIGVNSQPICVYANGSLYASVSGGIPPYSYAWSNGATDQNISGLVAGSYTVTVTDANMDSAMDSYILQETTLTGFGQFVPGCVDANLGFEPPYRLLATATSPIPGEIGAMGTAPITMGDGYMGTLLSHSSGYTFMYIEPPSGQWSGTGEVQIPFTDGSGCPGYVAATIPQTPDFPSVQLLSSQGSCSGGANGSIELYVGQAPNQWISELELVRDGTSLGLLRSAYSSNTEFGSTALSVIRHDLAPGNYQVLTTTVAQDYVLQEMMDTYFGGTMTLCRDTLFFTIPDLGYTCGTIEGEVFMDDDQNCVRNGSEPRFAGSILEIQPGGIFAMSDPFGRYWAQLPYGSYTIEQQSNLVVEHCTGAPIPFELSMGAPFIIENVADTGLISRDVSISLGSSAARPGFQLSYAAHVQNLTPGAVSGVTVTLTFDPVLSFISAVPANASVAGNVVTWNLGSIASFGEKNARVVLQVPPDVNLIGTDLLTSATVSVTQTEPYLSNNSFNSITTVTGSYDPNDKQVFTESNNDGLYLIAEDEWLDYTIRFQNTGNDTAFFVVVTDTLPNTVDPTTFVAGAASHSYRVDLSGQGALRFSFPNILLPDSNVSELESHGFVSFRIKAIEPVLPGTVIENTANIYFDYNEPVITDPSVLVAEFSTNVEERADDQLAVYPIPASDRVTVHNREGVIDQIQVIGADGRVERVQSGRSNNEVVNLEGLSSGLYVLRIRSSDNTVSYRTIVKAPTQ